jgi:hypothetical protein
VCPKCNRRGVHVEMDDHSFYTHFRIVSKDDPNHMLIRRVECYVSMAELNARLRARTLPRYASPST